MLITKKILQLVTITAFFFASFTLALTTRPISFNAAHAQCGNPECECNGWGTCTAQGCACQFSVSSCAYIPPKHEETKAHFELEMEETERWIIQDLFAGYLLPSLMAMTEEISAAVMHQTMIIGSFFDARMQLRTQRAVQEAHAQAQKDYHPSEGVCVYATNVRSLAMSQRKTDVNKNILSNQSLNRHLGVKGNNAADGVKTDLGEELISITEKQKYRSGRLQQFQDEYCDPTANNGVLKYLCGHNGTGASDRARIDNDIDFQRRFAGRETLNMDFMRTDIESSVSDKKDRADFLALNKNLYGHNVTFRPPLSAFSVPQDFFQNIESYPQNPYQAYMDFRSMTAQRSVAENSFHAQAAMKSRGDGGASYYLSILLQELGMSNDEISQVMQGSPSYDAQMEILTRKIYQNPQFFINLYDKPANVKRKQVAMKAIGMMQNWDIYETTMRIEMLASILLEQGLIEQQVVNAP